MKLIDYIYVALFTAVIGVMGFIPPIMLPISPVPITMQTLGVMFAGSLLGAKRGGLSLIVFLLLVAIGAPILSSGGGGIATLVGPTGGYVLGWPLAAVTIGYLTEKYWHSLTFFKLFIFHILGAMLLVYACGVTYLVATADIPWKVATLSALSFIPGDLLKSGIASYVALKMQKIHPLIKHKQTSIKQPRQNAS